jgi:chromosome segregation ATPase
MTKLFEEIASRIKKMKTKDELIEALEETKKALINQVNKSKQEVERKAKNLYTIANMINFKPCRAANIQVNSKPQAQLKKNSGKIIILKPRVCTQFSLTAMTIKPNNIIKNNAVFTMSTNRQVYREEKELVRAGKMLFKNIRWLPTVKMADKYNIKKIPLTYETSINTKDWRQTMAQQTARIYHNQGVVVTSEVRAFKFITNKPGLQAKINYIEKINRRIQGARQLNHYYETQYELAIAGMKCLDKLTEYNKELEEKEQIKKNKLKEINKITQENIKNNRAKVNKIKKEIKDLKQKREKNVKKYQESRYKAEKMRHKTHYYEKGCAAATAAYNKINEQYKKLNDFKNNCYGKIKRAAERNEINLQIDGFDHYN